MTSIDRIVDDSSFVAASQRHRRQVSVLLAVCLVGYFCLLLGAAYFRELFAIRLLGPVNLGLTLAMSQYLLSGLLALTYARVMRRMDRDMDTLAS